MKKKLICISCPAGCHLEADLKPDGGVTVTGNKCPRGAVYATDELTDPRRIVTAVVRSDSAATPYLPVRTDRPLPRRLIADLLNALYRMEVKTPVKCGDILIENVAGTGIKVRFSGDSEP